MNASNPFDNLDSEEDRSFIHAKNFVVGDILARTFIGRENIESEKIIMRWVSDAGENHDAFLTNEEINFFCQARQIKKISVGEWIPMEKFTTVDEFLDFWVIHCGNPQVLFLIDDFIKNPKNLR